MSQYLLPTFVDVTSMQKKWFVGSDYSHGLRKPSLCKHDGEPAAVVGFTGKFNKCGKINRDNCLGGIKTAGKHSGLRAAQCFGASFYARREKQQHKHTAVTKPSVGWARKRSYLDSRMKEISLDFTWVIEWGYKLLWEKTKTATWCSSSFQNTGITDST